LISKGFSNFFQFQAALTCHGVLLQDVLLEKPDLIAHVDPENYTFLYLLSILTNIQDGKPDNFIGTFFFRHGKAQHEKNRELSFSPFMIWKYFRGLRFRNSGFGFSGFRVSF
jgi:hypothetical protein